MRYNVTKLDKDAICSLLEAFSIETLSTPIKDNPKKFQKDIKGFRPNKMPILKLQQIYCDAIKSNSKIISNFLDEIVKERLDSIRVSNILETYDNNLIDTVFSLKERLVESKCAFRIKTIFSMSDISLSVQETTLLENLEVGLVKVFDSVQANNQKVDEVETTKVKLNKLNEKYSKTVADNKKEKQGLKDDLELTIRKNKQQDKELSMMKNTLDSIRKKLEAVSQEKETLEIQMQEMKLKLERKTDDTKNQGQIIKRLEADKEKLIEQISDSLQTISQLKTHQFSSYNVFETVEEVIRTLRVDKDKESKLEEYVAERFSVSTTILDAWDNISKESNDIVTYICNKMDENIINTFDIEKLNNLERDICIEYIISKSIKSLCIRFLEQEERKDTIEEKIMLEL